VEISHISKEVISYKEAKLLVLLKVEATARGDESFSSALTSEQGFFSKEPFPDFLVRFYASIHTS